MRKLVNLRIGLVSDLEFKMTPDNGGLVLTIQTTGVLPEEIAYTSLAQFQAFVARARMLLETIPV